jgi:hypothetical protein
MKIVIQCAGSKNDGGYWQLKSGERVMFVAHPGKKAPPFQGHYAHPDDVFESDKSWRERLLDYNAKPAKNPFNLHPAYLLYKNRVYRNLVAQFGPDNIYILSAGWGLIRSDFLTPQYDITFQAQAAPYKRREKNDKYNDFCMLPQDVQDCIVYLGGKDYLPLFHNLTKNLTARKIILNNQKTVPYYEDYQTHRYQTKAKTNWHYACAQEIIAGTFKVGE